MHNWWPPEVQARHDHLFLTEHKDTWIFRNRKDGIYFAVGGLDALGIHTLMMCADVVKYSNQRLLGVTFTEVKGWRRSR